MPTGNASVVPRRSAFCRSLPQGSGRVCARMGCRRQKSFEKMFKPWIVAAVSCAATSLGAPLASADVEHGPVAGPVIVSTPQYRRRPGLRYMLPLKVDIGFADVHTARGFVGGIGAAVGVHWASLSPTPTDFDIGLGVFGTLLVVPSDNNPMTTDSAAYGGAYLEGAHTLSQNDWGRTWAGLRGEYVSSEAFSVDHKGYGVAGRLSAELYASGVGIEPRGLFLGSYAIGVYVEGAVRDLAPGISDFQATAGLTFRTPFVISP